MGLIGCLHTPYPISIIQIDIVWLPAQSLMQHITILKAPRTCIPLFARNWRIQLYANQQRTRYAGRGVFLASTLQHPMQAGLEGSCCAYFPLPFALLLISAIFAPIMSVFGGDEAEAC
jgi:hypothetical protein